MSEKANLQEMNPEEILQWIMNPQDHQQLEEYYDEFAKNYEQVSVELFGRGELEDKSFLEKIVKYVPKDASILDAGAGTGIAGQQLYHLGYYNLTGIDLSQGMLAEAEKKNVYTSLKQMVLGGPLDFPDHFFDAVIASRAIGHNHAPTSSFDELIRITKRGGYIIFTIKSDFYENSDFKEKLSTLEASGKWELAEEGEKYKPLPKVDPNLYCQVWVCRVI